MNSLHAGAFLPVKWRARAEVNSQRRLLTVLAGLAVMGLPAQTGGERPRLRPVPSAGENMKTGPAVGEKIPGFELIDQDGRKQNLASLSGPKGLMLAFVRSADW
jgi:hypothetical protein